MRKPYCLMLWVFVVVAACVFAQGPRTIQADITYTGSGTVNASHKIYVALWDSADFDSGPPAATRALDSKRGTVTFMDVRKVPAYVSTAYDPTGAWDAQSPPPRGSSLGVYSLHPPAPAPVDVAPGKTAKVKITFDDSVKAP